MRITRKIQSDINYIKNTPKRNQYQYQQHPQTEQIREKRIESIPINKKPLLLQKIQPANCDNSQKIIYLVKEFILLKQQM